MANRQPQILNLDDILADEAQRTIVWKGKSYEITGVTGEAYLRFLSKQTLINKAMESGDLEKQWATSLDLLKFLAPELPLDEMQKMPWKAFQQVVTFVMAVFQEEAGTTADDGQQTAVSGQQSAVDSDGPGE